MFKLVTPVAFSLKMNLQNPLKRSIQSHTFNKRLFSSNIKYFKNNNNYYKNYTIAKSMHASKDKPNLSLTFLGILGVSSLYLVAHKPILNETAGFANQPVSINTQQAANVYYDDTKSFYDGAFNGKLNYHQVALGSMTGLILGYAISRLSTVLFCFSLAFYLINVYLRKQGIISIDTKKMVKGAVSSISWDELVFEQTSFSVPFVCSFLMSATL